MKRLALIALIALPAAAHDFWIEPSAFRPAAGETVRLALRQGEHFEGEPVTWNPQRIARAVVRSASGVTNLRGGAIALTEPGLAIVTYETKPKVHEPMTAATFEAYLREEGLERIIRERAARGESAKNGTEMFSRSAKSLLASGAGFDQPLGMRYEIVPLTDPDAAAALKCRVLFEGKPVEGALVVAMLRGDRSVRVEARSDRDGMLTLPLRRSGVWLVKSVHMTAAPPESGVEWESIWASLTFERRQIASASVSRSRSKTKKPVSSDSVE